VLAEIPLAIASKRNSPALGPGFRFVADRAVLARLLLWELAGPNQNSAARRPRPATQLRIRGSRSRRDAAVAVDLACPCVGRGGGIGEARLAKFKSGEHFGTARPCGTAGTVPGG
jgi:hypothetical protein